MLSSFCALVFKGEVSPQVSVPRSNNKVKSEPLSDGESQETSVHFGHTQVYGTWWDGSEGAELTDSTAKSVCFIFERSWRSRQVLNDWKSANIYPCPKEKVWETTGPSASSQSLNTLRNEPSGKLLP